MAVDALFKKYFAGVVLALVATAAYFQAQGATALVGASISPGSDALATLPPRPPNMAALRQRSSAGEQKSAEPILSRNPFDSETGPLNATPLDTSDLKTEPGGGDVDASNPLTAPACSDVSVHIVTESDDPRWSLAALKGPGDPEPRIRRVGDDVAGKQVAYIGFNPTEASPAVWMVTGSALCQSLLFAEQPKVESKPATRAKPKDDRKKRRKGAPTVPKDIADKIKKNSETDFDVDRVVVDKILENQAELMRSARIVPEKKDGKVVGIRMFGIRDNTLLGTLGFQNGDRLESINGFDMTSPEKALEAYARLRTAPRLTVKINRRGKPMSVDFNIK